MLSSNANPTLFSSPIIAKEHGFDSFMPKTRNCIFDPKGRSGCENVFLLSCKYGFQWQEHPRKLVWSLTPPYVMCHTHTFYRYNGRHKKTQTDLGGWADMDIRHIKLFDCASIFFVDTLILAPPSPLWLYALLTLPNGRAFLLAATIVIIIFFYGHLRL